MFELWNYCTERDECLFELTSAEANAEHQNNENALGIKCADRQELNIFVFWTIN